MSTFEDFAASLADEPVITGSKKERETHPCGQCSGTGKWSGGTNRHGNSNCLACKGKGFFYASPAERFKAKAQRVARKAKLAQDAKDDFMAEHEGLIEGLRAMQWHNIASSLLASFDKYNALTDKQAALASKIVAEQAERDAKRAAERAALNVKVDLGRVEEIFATAQMSGIQYPKLRLNGLVLSKAGPNAKNAGAINVKAGPAFEDDYYGYVRDGELTAFRKCTTEVTEALQALAADPLSSATAYGHKFGICACCGRTLTNKDSIERGIGPICAANWGLA